MGKTDRLMRPEEVAERLGVAKATLYSWRLRRQGPPSVKIEGALRYSETALGSWVEDRRTAEDVRNREISSC
jgi:predicted DNA-binding transcriptional regulator AlpA